MKGGTSRRVRILKVREILEYVKINTVSQYTEIKCQLDATEVFIADLIAFSTCFGHHYAHRQELKSIITLNSTSDQQLENHSTKYHRQQPMYNTLKLLMVGILMPETCRASNKICSKNLCCIYV